MIKEGIFVLVCFHFMSTGWLFHWFGMGSLGWYGNTVDWWFCLIYLLGLYLLEGVADWLILYIYLHSQLLILSDTRSRLENPFLD